MTVGEIQEMGMKKETEEFEVWEMNHSGITLFSFM